MICPKLMPTPNCPQSVSGTSSGTCASGFGVCCVVSKTCGESSSTNNTYLDQVKTFLLPISM